MYTVENESRQQAKLQECEEVGMNCEDCVQSSASTTAMFCSSLGGDGIDMAFRLMYRQPECQPMHASFHFYYIEATHPNSLEVLGAIA